MLGIFKEAAHLANNQSIKGSELEKLGELLAIEGSGKRKSAKSNKRQIKILHRKTRVS